MFIWRDGGTVQTFAAGFADPRFDELPYARIVADALQTEHHEIHVTPQDFRDLWGKLSWHRDGPISEPADIAIHRIATYARSYVKVLLSGGREPALGVMSIYVVLAVLGCMVLYAISKSGYKKTA